VARATIRIGLTRTSHVAMYQNSSPVNSIVLRGRGGICIRSGKCDVVPESVPIGKSFCLPVEKNISSSVPLDIPSSTNIHTIPATYIPYRKPQIHRLLLCTYHSPVVSRLDSGTDDGICKVYRTYNVTSDFVIVTICCCCCIVMRRREGRNPFFSSGRRKRSWERVVLDTIHRRGSERDKIRIVVSSSFLHSQSQSIIFVHRQEEECDNRTLIEFTIEKR